MKDFVIIADERFLQDYGTRTLHRALAERGWDEDSPCNITLAFDVTKYVGSTSVRNYVFPSILNDVTELMKIGCIVSIEETHPAIIA